MKKLINIFLVICSMFLFVSCANKNTEEEKVLNIYTWTSFIPEKVVKDFEAKTGIKVNISFYDTNNTMLTKLMSGTNQYDIVSPSTDFVKIMVENKLLLKLDKAKLGDTFKNLDADNLQLYKYAEQYDPNLNYSIPYGFFATGITVNTDVVGKNFPRNIKIFENPKFKGRMTMLDDPRETIGLALQSLGYPSDSDNDKQLEQAKELLISIKKNLAKYDSDTFGQGLASGEFVISHGYPDVFYMTSKEEQKKFVYFLPEKAAMMYIDNMAICANAQHKENAYKFLTYLYEPENYKYVFERFRQIPVVKGVTKLTDVKPILSLKEILENATLPNALSPEATQKQEKIWSEIKLAQ